MSRLGLFFSVLLLAACGGGGGGGGSETKSAGLAPPGANSGVNGSDPSLTFSASATSVEVGDSVTLEWEARNVDDCTASGAWGGSKSLSGSETIGPLSDDVVFSLSCSGKGGGLLREIGVTVIDGDLVSINLDVDKDLVHRGESATITWSTDNATECSASGAWSGSIETSGEYTTPPLTDTQSFSLTCSNSSQNAVAVLSIRVGDLMVSWDAPTHNVDGSRLTDLAGFKVYWGTQPGSYTESRRVDANTLQWVFEDLSSGTYHVAVTALRDFGVESEFSAEVVKIVP